MTLPRLFHAFRAVVAGTLIVTLAAPVAAQPERPGEVPYGRRTDAFRRLLFELRLQPLKTFAELQDDPSRSILVALGDPSCLSRGYFPEGLRNFVEQGGAVLIATDKATQGDVGRNLSELAGVSVTGETLVCPLPSHDQTYNGNAYCPFVQPTDPDPLSRSANVLGVLAALVDGGGRPALFRNLHPDQPDLRVATNAPSRLRVQGWLLPRGVHRLARLPPDCQTEEIFLGQIPPRSSPPLSGPRVFGPRDIIPKRSGMSRNPERQESTLFAVGGNVGKGRILVLADHSIFINRMILPRDTGNLEFAANCLHWLRGGVSSLPEAMKAANSPQGLQQLTGQRDKVLFWDDGQVRTNFEVPLKTMPITPPLGAEPAIVAAIDQTLARAEDQNRFNRELLEGLGEHGWTMTRLWRNVLYLFSFAFLLLLGYRFVWRDRYRPEVGVPRLARVVAEHEPKASLLEQRRWALLRAGNVWEMAHQSARHLFQSAGVPLTTGSSAPHLTVQGGRWRRWRVGRRVRRLWELARGDRPARIRPAALKHWLRDLDELKNALAKGTIQLTDTGERPA